MEMSDYKVLNNRTIRYIIVKKDNFSKDTWCLPLENTNNQSITDEISRTLTTPKRKPIIKESDRKTEFYNSIFQNLLKLYTSPFTIY